MRVLIMESLGFHTSVASLHHSIEERGIELVIIDEIKTKNMIPFALELDPIIMTLIESVPVHEIKTISRNRVRYEKNLSSINTLRNIRNIKFVRQRHVPTNRGK